MIDPHHNGEHQNGSTNSHSGQFGLASQAGDGVNAKYYAHVLLERRWLIITTFVAVLALGLIYLFGSSSESVGKEGWISAKLLR